jgi:hypothetical protein
MVMGRMRGWLALTVVAATGAGIVLLPPERARADAPAAADAPTVSSLANMRDGFKWGITHTDVITAFNKQGGLWDQEYDPLLRKAQPGVQQQALEADRDNKKAALERSYVRFVTPTGYDSTDLKDEYTYRNNEAILAVERQGKKRYFFFMGAEPNERLWKIYDEIPLTASGPMGATFAEGVNRVQAIIGVVGRARAADPSNGLTYTSVDWQDGQTHLRLLDRSRHHVIGVVLEERATLNALPQLRSNKADDLMAVDPSIAAATRSDISDPSKNAAPAPSSSAAKPKKR